MNFDLDLWHCMGCDGGGPIEQLLKQLRKARKEDKPVNGVKVKSKTTKTSKLPAKKPKPLPSEEIIEHWHARLVKQTACLAYVTEKRGLTRATIDEYQIGWDGFRYTIPIRDEHGELVNVRRYDPKKNDKNKMISWGEGHGKARIYGIELLLDPEVKEVVFCEGEWDRLVALQMGLPAITHTAGAMTFDRRWAPLFKGKRVFFCYDNDDSGRRGMIKGARSIKAMADAVYTIKLDIDIKGGDLTDFFILQGRTVEEFRELMERAEQRPFGEKKGHPDPPLTGISVSLEESQSTEYGDKPLEMVVSISGKKAPPYIVPRRIAAKCDQGKGQVCTICPMMDHNGDYLHEVYPDDPVVVEFTDINAVVKQSVMKEMIGAKCSDHVTYAVEENWTVEQLIATNSVEHRSNEQQTPMMRPIFNVGTYKTPINITARMVGRQVPSPKDQVGLFHSWHLEPTQTNLDKFQVSPEMIERLRIFRPRKGQSPLDRCKDIAHDVAHNVSRIYGRPELHIAYDLVWHSILDFDFQGQRIGKGWLELLVVGDTRTGKSEAATNLAEHYNAGVIKSCEGMTFAGLVGGVQQIGGKHWMVSWGTIPLNDRRLVVLDEVSGLKDKDVIEQMSSIRSSGKAQLTKIATDEASARTRLIWISNPPDGRMLREVNGGGMEVIRQLVNNPEDIARFDFAISAASDDVDSDIINSNKHEDVTHKFTDELCAELVMWAWSRSADQVYWMEGVENEVIEAAKEFGKRYVPDPPLVQIENVRMKLARIAVALAARTFSSDRSGELVIVKDSHVHDAVRFLDLVYGMDSFGYLRHSRRAINARSAAERFKKETRAYLKEHDEDVLHTLLSIGGDQFKMRDFEEMGAMDRVDAQVAVRTLLEWKMVRRMRRGTMRMEPALIELLREHEDKDAS